MDAQEFKKKYPHLSHLEGNDLWNAMEDAWIKEHRHDQKEITDWKGNVIKPGDEICFIKIKDKNYFSNMAIMTPVDGITGPGDTQVPGIEFYQYGLGNMSLHKPRPENDCWEVEEYIKVDNNLCITKKMQGFSITQHLSTCMNFIDTSCVILAIKGVSDMQPGKIIKP